MKTIKREIVAAIIKSQDNKMLMLRKNPQLGGVYLDYWHIPGGGKEKHESFDQTLERELKEELGINIKQHTWKLIDDKGKDISKRTHTDSSKDIMVDMSFIVYELIIDKKSFEIEISLSEEHVEFKWFTLDEVQTTKITPPSFRLFKKLGYVK